MKQVNADSFYSRTTKKLKICKIIDSDLTQNIHLSERGQMSLLFASTDIIRTVRLNIHACIDVYFLLKDCIWIGIRMAQVEVLNIQTSRINLK